MPLRSSVSPIGGGRCGVRSQVIAPMVRRAAGSEERRRESSGRRVAPPAGVNADWAGAPVPYRAYEAGGSRFGWTVPPIRYLVSRHFFPRYFAVTLRLRPDGDWTVAQLKGCEFEDEARRWAGSLWRDARRARQG